jgi:hypothetical protein
MSLANRMPKEHAATVQIHAGHGDPTSSWRAFNLNGGPGDPGKVAVAIMLVKNCVIRTPSHWSLPVAVLAV